MTAPAGTRRSLWQRLYHGETSFDFVGPRRKWFLLSAIVIGIGLLSLATKGLNFGIDFTGGTAWEVPATGVSEAEVRGALRPVGLGDATIQIIGGERVRVQADTETGTREEREQREDEVRRALAEVTGTTPDQVSVNQVGPSWGADITRKAARALVAFLVVITAYITMRFELKMALASLVALFHDILVTAGVYSLSGFEVTPATVVAFLTILGYSLYDTIVVFDKVEENTRGLAATGRMTYSDTVNLSMNQVLMRSLNTSLVAILPIFSVLFVGAFLLGATTLQDFGLALFIGLLTGAYSSIFIASPILAVLKEREPRYAALRQRLESRPGGAPLAPAAAGRRGDAEPATVSGDGAGGRPPTSRPPAPRTGPVPRGSAAPRPRKKGRRR